MLLNFILCITIFMCVSVIKWATLVRKIHILLHWKIWVPLLCCDMCGTVKFRFNGNTVGIPYFVANGMRIFCVLKLLSMPYTSYMSLWCRMKNRDVLDHRIAGLLCTSITTARICTPNTMLKKIYLTCKMHCTQVTSCQSGPFPMIEIEIVHVRNMFIVNTKHS